MFASSWSSGDWATVFHLFCGSYTTTSLSEDPLSRRFLSSLLGVSCAANLLALEAVLCRMGSLWISVESLLLLLLAGALLPTGFRGRSPGDSLLLRVWIADRNACPILLLSVQMFVTGLSCLGSTLELFCVPQA